jgi:Ca2+-binding RTX toxin-like protein
MPTPTRTGDAFIPNTTLAGNQIGAVLARLEGGGFVAAWTDGSASGGDTSDTAVRAQRFDADGTPVGAEILVNTTTAGAQFFADIAALEGGGFVVAWEDRSATGGDTSTGAVRAQVFGATGEPVGTEILVNTTTANVQGDPSVAGLAGGGFVVSWDDASQIGVSDSLLDVRARIFGPGGTPAGPEFRANTTTLNSQENSAVTVLEGGDIILAWDDFSQQGADTSEDGLRLQRYRPDGTAVGPEVLVNTLRTGDQSNPAVTALRGGGYVVTWTSEDPTGGDASVSSARGQVFDAAGVARTAEFQINTATAGFQAELSVAALEDGRFVVVWTDASATGGDTSVWAVRGQVFTAAGARDGDEFLVNDITAGLQYLPDVTALAGGGFAVVWTNSGITPEEPTGGLNLRVQIFDAGTAPVTTITGTPEADVLRGFFGGDRILALAGNDRLDGGTGRDTMEGGLGNDIYFVDDLGDVVQGEVGFAQGGGIDTVFTRVDLTAPANVEILRAEAGVAGVDLTGNDAPGTLVGNEGANRLDGRGGNDQLNGNAGNDVLTGGEGADTLVGGAGADQFVFNAVSNSRAGAANRDVINGFDRGATQDIINLDPIDANSGVAGDQDFTFIGTGPFTAAGQVRVLGLGGANAVIVEVNVNADLAADMQIFVNLQTTMGLGDFDL